ncbi:MAG: hypothetical protein K2I87_02795 [Bacteroidales bacterium]|nr:hypothetical protein [Bacteroidales bacterium]
MTSEYIKAVGIWYANELPTIKKKKDAVLQPIFEAFTNAWEAIVEKYTIGHITNGRLSVNVYLQSDIYSKDDKTYNFDKITVFDNGIGLNNNSYTRLLNLRDNTKSSLNKGTGRIQYIHFFDDTTIESIYRSDENTYKERMVTLSKKETFLKQNAILRLDKDGDIKATDTYTIVTFSNPLEEKERDTYRNISSKEIKEALIEHFLSKFCDSRERLPHISIHKYIDEKEVESQNISSQDIPMPDKEDSVCVHYSKLGERRKIVPITDRMEGFTLRAFKHSEDILGKNVIYLVSNGAIGTKIHLDNLAETDKVNGMRYMFLLSGNYIDNNDSDDRGNINILSADEFKEQEKDPSLFPQEVILLDDIETETNKKIEELYQEIKERSKLKLRNIEDLQQMFLLNPQTVETLKTSIKNTDTDAQILQKIYERDAKIKAQQDAAIKQQIDGLSALMPTDANYQERLKEQIDEFVRTIPLQNRTALSQYVARRKLVLEIFEKILDRELERLRDGGRIDEDILHNLIFQQSSEDTENSDLWLINEEYIYFKGVSEHRLVDIEYNGKKIFNKEFSEEDKKSLNSLGERRLTKRPDILLFPEEGKCIIIEFKAPDVNVSEHLNQINFYASLLRNYTIDELQLTAFYGYLIGQSIEDRDVRGRVSRFEYAPRFGYWFCPSEKVIDFNGGNDGSIYTEIIKYSSLLDRAKLRNKIFIDKLEKGNNP